MENFDKNSNTNFYWYFQGQCDPALKQNKTIRIFVSHQKTQFFGFHFGKKKILQRADTFCGDII